jgi:hypothetical protein
MRRGIHFLGFPLGEVSMGQRFRFYFVFSALIVFFFVPRPVLAGWIQDGTVVCDASGRLVKRLAGGYRERGMHSVSWAGRDAAGREVGSGMYFLRLRAGKDIRSRKMILLR